MVVLLTIDSFRIEEGMKWKENLYVILRNVKLNILCAI
jgi:hypothetical protein